ncbi:MaoC family dehydratase N-terminal domain-containing protein [Yinghuangia sp. ASG 101]|uniref:FAS1-like dehydratase domain-containing protein n=1 Tax=Yinghuangia sp. ASG 101 TaxID=2896848 RepID=UPI001E392352|nr:MaoC family dehydratase N-terminal domain-containing protein [Yinghuangia sp. ASG 101]UGQ11257.1 MaoC family dehydratase N-terminal domain-containing protein [Yinghuangia sp. ASG 101]
MAVTAFPVEAGHLLVFARAIGDHDPAYHADLADPGARPVAPPTFTMAAAHHDDEYPLRPLPGKEWFGSGAGAGFTLDGADGLHAEQHFEYHRPLRVGDVLSGSTRQGRSWEKTGRAGVLRFTEQITEYRDATGGLVVTARSVGVTTQAPTTEPGSENTRRNG